MAECALEGEPGVSNSLPRVIFFPQKNLLQLQLPPEPSATSGKIPPLIGLLMVWYLVFQFQPCLFISFLSFAVGYSGSYYFLPILILQNSPVNSLSVFGLSVHWIRQGWDCGKMSEVSHVSVRSDPIFIIHHRFCFT